ncbi:hypothetical protein MKZ38_002259 [Zalerion maritima]|uniref:DUF676 domain-containing protein n=1 Tax=Zalerion maritima TaxID=339359 RepID=A0AAD5RP94_9PEZI|nr:hypothetical protein MKZ38_002259 [Zalerion maritima]
MDPDYSSGAPSGSSRAGRAPPRLPPRQQSSVSGSNIGGAMASSPYSPWTSYGKDADAPFPPPSYDSIANTIPSPPQQQQHQLWTIQDDPRTSSTQSLVPSESSFSSSSATASQQQQRRERRKLLLVYIHGFMGNETSFRSFPAHVHNLLTVLLSETHVVHTKIYPRYHSKRNISFARDDFSRWLEPHEGQKTDVVFMGHSMGGLLSAEVVLMPVAPGTGGEAPLKHRILGTINFDVPFLGMHPGVVKSGLASIFNPVEEQGDKWLPPPPDSDIGSHVPSVYGSGGHSSPPSVSSLSIGRNDTLWTPERPDPNFNPSFANDVVLPMRKGWKNAAHFVNKHSDHLFKSTKQLVTSHLEFGGAMASYGELKVRYARFRALEDEDKAVRAMSVVAAKNSNSNSNVPPRRVRFINYYTASTGRVKKPKSPTRSMTPTRDNNDNENNDISNMKLGDNNLSPHVAYEETARGRRSLQQGRADAGAGGSLRADHSSQSHSPRISLEEHSSDGVVKRKEPEIPETPDSDGSGGNQVWEDAAETLKIDDSQRRSRNVARPPPPDAGVPPTTQNSDDVDDGRPLLTSPSTSSISTLSALPPIPDLPPAPPPLDVSYIQDDDTRKLVEKEHARAVKAYAKAVKDLEKVMRDRAKLEEKKEKKSKRDADKAAKYQIKAVQKAKQETRKREEEAERLKRKRQEEEKKKRGKERKEREMTHQEKEELRLEKERLRMEAEGRRLRGEKSPKRKEDEKEKEETKILKEKMDDDNAPPAVQLLPSSVSSPSGSESEPGLERRRSRSASTSLNPPSAKSKEKEKQKQKGPPKDRKFCTLPPKDASGQRDACWVRVFMENVDEVGAHCGLFFVDERYERLVGDVAERIERWVREDIDERVVREGGFW